MEKLTFLRSLTVEQFKSQMGCSKISIRQGSNGLFFTAGEVKGAVASNGIPQRPLFSEVQGVSSELNSSGVFWLLHEESTSNEIATL